MWSYITLYILPVLSTEYYTLYITRHYLLINAYAYVLVMCCESLCLLHCTVWYITLYVVTLHVLDV